MRTHQLPRSARARIRRLARKLRRQCTEAAGCLLASLRDRARARNQGATPCALCYVSAAALAAAAKMGRCPGEETHDH